MTQQKPAEDFTRTIVLIYGALESGRPFWAFAAVRPSRYQPLLAAQKDASLNLYQFESYGEIIVSGEGRTPPDDVTLKVAEMYQTDPAALIKASHEEKNQP